MVAVFSGSPADSIDFSLGTTAEKKLFALKDYFLVQVEARKNNPTEDIIGDLVTAKINGEKLTDEAIYSFLRLLLPAGLETTYRSSGNLLYLLLSHPEQFAAVRESHEFVGPAIEEALRFETPLTTVQRFASDVTELEGVEIPANSVVDVCMGSANRDGTRWERPEEFDVCRKRTPHITFARANTPVSVCIWRAWRPGSPCSVFSAG
jgi:cytochrome P450